MPQAVRTVNCPSCGAPADLAPNARSGKCRYCGATIERVEHPAPPPSPPPTVSLPSQPPTVYISQTRVTTQQRSARASGSCFGSLVSLIVVGLLAGLGVVVILQGAPGQLSNLPESLMGIIPSPLVANQTFHFIPAANDGPPAVVGTVYDINTEKYSIAYLAGGAKPKLQWQAVERKKYPNPFVVAANPDYVYTTVDSRVLALNRSDGTVAWENSLTDALPYCQAGCWQVVGERLIALTKDGTLQAFNTKTGKQVWNMPFENIPQRFWVAFDQLLILVRVEGEVQLLFIDPQAGEATQTWTPRCPQNGDSFADGLDTDTPLVVDEANDALYLVYEAYPKPCVQRWAVAKGELVWQTQFEANEHHHLREAQPLLTAEALYFDSNTQLFRVAVDTGEVTVLLTDEDYDFVPLALDADRLLVRATSQRGTEKFELRGLDPTTGKQAWLFALGEAQPLDPPDAATSLVSEGDSVWTWHLTNAGLTIVQFHASPHEIRITTLDPAEGVSLEAEQVIPIATNTSVSFLSPPQVVGWVKDVLWVVLENRLNTVDMATSTKVLWP